MDSEAEPLMSLTVLFKILPGIVEPAPTRFRKSSSS
jgi:hypothetical protein